MFLHNLIKHTGSVEAWTRSAFTGPTLYILHCKIKITYQGLLLSTYFFNTVQTSINDT